MANSDGDHGCDRRHRQLRSDRTVGAGPPDVPRHDAGPDGDPDHRAGARDARGQVPDLRRHPRHAARRGDRAGEDRVQEAGGREADHTPAGGGVAGTDGRVHGHSKYSIYFYFRRVQEWTAKIPCLLLPQIL